MMRSDRIWVLIAKRNAGEASNSELQELESLLAADSQAGYTSEIIDKIWGAPLNIHSGSDLPDGTWSKIEKRTAYLRRIMPPYSWRRWIAAASVLLVFSFAGFLAAGYFGENSSGGPDSEKLNQVSTSPGSKSKLELPDGTLVWLNGDSKLTYSNAAFGKDGRQVTLTGEAFFDVVKNEKNPFVIHTGTVMITVKGTAFNVKAYPGEKTVETALVRGLVEISTAQDPDRKILLKPNEKIIIPVRQPESVSAAPDEQDSARASLYSITRLHAVNEEPAEIAWIKTQLVFDDEPFDKLAPKMESWFNVKIQFTDEEVKGKRFSGVIENESLKQTLEAMRLSYPFQYQIRDGHLRISK